MRCARHLRNQRIFFAVMGVLSLMLTIFFFRISRPGEHGLSKEAYRHEITIHHLSLYTRRESTPAEEEAAQRAQALRQTYEDAGEVIPFRLNLETGGLGMGGFPPFSEERARDMRARVAKYRQKRNLAAEEGRREAFPVAGVLLVFTLLCGVSMWLVKPMPLLVPVAAAILYSVALWQIRSSWTGAHLIAVPILLFGYWLFYRPLLEGVLLGIQMRRERRAQADAQDVPPASPTVGTS